MKYLKVESIDLNIAGKIKNMIVWDEISRTKQIIPVEKLLHMIENKEVTLNNLSITPDRKILTTVGEYLELHIGVYNTDSIMGNIDIEIVNIIYENRLVIDLYDYEIAKHILAVDLRCKTELEKQVFKSLGGILVGENIIRINKIQIKKLINNNIFMKDKFEEYGIVDFIAEDTGSTSYVYIGCDKEIHLTEDKTNREKLENWLTKIKILGKSFDYDINIESSELIFYNGQDEVPVLPPVREISAFAFGPDTRMKILNIPNSVEVIRSNVRASSGTIEQINFGNSVYTLDQRYGSFSELDSIKELDFKNITEINLTNYSGKIKANIQAKMKIASLAHTVQIELSE